MVSAHSNKARTGATVVTALAKQAVLPEQEQVSRGQELLHMLWQQPSESDSCDFPRTCNFGDFEAEEEDVDVQVIVKNGFIEVVDPQCRQKMNRSMSDSALLHCPADRQQQWQQISTEKWTSHDLSDASTTISGNDADDLSVRGRVRNDTCWSDDEGAFEMMPPYMPYGYDGTWWMPMAFDPNTTMLCAMPDGSMCPVSTEWVQQSGIECEGAEEESDQEWRTTVMLRNMPNNYTRDMLLELVDSMGFSNCYDFAYLPVDFKSQAGLGYAFINFISSAEAMRCFDNFEGFSGWKVPSDKVCTVTWGSPYQGLEAHIERYQNSPVMHHSIPDEWKPVLVQQGERIAFPAPTKPIKTPKVRQQPAAN